MNGETHHHPHLFKDKSAAGAQPMALVNIIKQEVRSIAGINVDSVYAAWMLSPPKSKDVFLLQPDQLLHPPSFCEALKKAEPGSAYEILRRRLPPKMMAALASVEIIPAETIASLTHELNALLRKEELLFPDLSLASLRIPAELVALIQKEQAGSKWIAINRLLLEAALPNDVVKVSDTLPGLYAWLHAHPRTALCFSGGGIRSATFGLGVLQGLGRHGLLDQFDYLSTVSGGGYVGSWLSAWISREGSSRKVFAALANENDTTPLSPEPEQVRHLREFSNYLSPRLGILSADTWTLVGTYFRNLLLNWVIFIPALATLLLIPRLCVSVLHLRMGFTSLVTLTTVGLLSGIWAIVYAAVHRPGIWKGSDDSSPPDPKAGSQARFLTFCFAPLWISATCFILSWAWLQNSVDAPRLLKFAHVSNGASLPLADFIYAGAAFHFLAWCCYAWRLHRGRVSEFFGVVFTGGFGGMLLWLGAHFSNSNLNLAPNLEWYVCFAAPCYLLAFLLTASIFIGLTSRITTDSDREWWARMGAWLLIGILSWSSFCILVLFGPECLCSIPAFFASIGGVSTLATLLLGYSHSTPANKKQQKETDPKSRLADLGLALAAPLFVACLIATISLATTRLFKAIELNPAFAGAAEFHANDIHDLPFLAGALNLTQTQTPDALTRYLWENLSPSARQKLQDPTIVKAKDSPLRSILAADFNRIIQTNELYQAVRFAGVPLSPKTESIVGPDWHGQRLMRFNRLLLQDSFPESIVNSQFDPNMITHQTPLRNVVIVFICFGAVAWVLSRFISINRFSLYEVYRNRLIRAYLGASNPRRRANPFSGFDPADNLFLSQLRPRPFHIINMALNLVTDSNLAWQQRKAESFTASRLHAGNYRLGYRDVSRYASHDVLEKFLGGAKETVDGTAAPDSPESNDKDKRGLTLGTAVAISGAAASPNSGYHSSPVVAVLMTLFNVRLGAWLGNPGPAGNKSFTHRGPQSAVWHVVKEALGLTDDTAEYVYLSDGGHFENLGIYEMVLRRVHFIVVSDAGCDPDCALEDLGNAIRKIRIDLGIPIEIDQFNIGSRSNKPESKYCAIGHIDYAHVDGPGTEPGVLIYIKPAIAGTEPRDVFNYAESSVLFPHEPTSDQWFTESQFESYRILGLHIIHTMCSGSDGLWTNPHHALPLDRFKEQASDYLKNLVPPIGQASPEKTIIPELK